MKNLHPAKDQLHNLQVKACSLQVLTEAREIVFHNPQVRMEDRETAFHILQVQMAALGKVAFHSLGRMDSFHIPQAHVEHRIAQDDLLEDSHWHIQVAALALAHIHAPLCQRLLRLPWHPLAFLPFHWQVHIHLCQVRSHPSPVRKDHPFQGHRVRPCHILEEHNLLFPYPVSLGN